MANETTPSTDGWYQPLVRAKRWHYFDAAGKGKSLCQRHYVNTDPAWRAERFHAEPPAQPKAACLSCLRAFLALKRV